jgi:hypothetical protein
MTDDTNSESSATRPPTKEESRSVFEQHMNTPVAHPLDKAATPSTRAVALVIFGAHVSKEEAEILIELFRKDAGLDIHETRVIEYDASLGTPDIIFK